MVTKEGQRWYLARGGGAWVFPEAQDTIAQSTAIGPRNHPPEISWQLLHEKLGHASEKKLRELEKTGLVKLTGKCEINKCEPCRLCETRRTNITGIVTHSVEVVVQVDGMHALERRV